jgi:AhpD family alkylhydroperoxidase
MHYHESGDFDYQKVLAEVAPSQTKAFGAFDAAVFDKDDEVLDLRTKELIAIGVAATTQCPYCLAGHVAKAKKAGATEEHLSRAIMIAAALRAGAAFTHGFLALKLYDQK